MAARRPSSWLLLLFAAAAGVAGCEPYMSLTDRIPAQTRQATALLPEAPRYAGMIDVETVMGQIDELGSRRLVDSLRQVDNTRLRTFLDVTGLDPETDLKAVYGAVGGGASFEAVVFADLTPTQLDRYLERAPDAGRAATYREVPVYHLVAGTRRADEPASPDTLSLGFVRSGMIAVAKDVDRVEAMIDRHRDQTGGFRGKESYMGLVERVGHGSTAWLVGRDVLQTALRDSAAGDPGEGVTASAGRVPGVNEAGIQELLSMWADRILGLSEAPSSLEGATDGKVERLTNRVREQAVSVTLGDEALEGEAYLTMRDETSASNVVDVSKGAMAALRLSGEDAGEIQQELLDGVHIERDGAIVHAQITVDRERLRRTLQARREGRAAHRSEVSVRRSKGAARRFAGITPGASALGAVRRACNLCVDRPVFPLAGGAGS